MLNKLKKLNKITLAFILTVVYVGFQATGKWALVNVFGVNYGEPGMGFYMLPWMLILGPFALWAAKRFYESPKEFFEKIDKKYLILVSIPLIAIIFSALFSIFTINVGDIPGYYLYATLLATLLVGIGEETLFRGIFINSFKKSMPLWLAVLMSAIVFAAIHGVNLVAGQPLADTLSQLQGTFIMGLAYGGIYIFTRSLFATIIIHWLWDFTLLSTKFDPNLMSKFEALPFNTLTIAGITSIGIGVLLFIWLCIRGFFKKNKNIATKES